MDLSPQTLRILIALAVAAAGIIILLIGHRLRLRWRDPVRLFTWTQKKALIEQARGRCEHKPMLWRRCSEPGTDADHVTPWSKGGATELYNGQLLCRRHNRRKSNHLPGPLYRWRLQRRRRRYATGRSQAPSFRARGAH